MTEKYPSRWLSVAVSSALALVLSACATSGAPLPARTTSASEFESPSLPAGRDLVTQSDESDLRRRARIRLELATAYYARGELKTALDEVKQVLAIDDRFADAMELRGLIYDLLNEPALAEESFRRASQMDPRNGSVLHNYGWFLCRKGQFDKADPLFARAAELPSTVSPAKTMLVRGVCQSLGGRMADAEKTLARAYELDPSNPATAFNLSRVLFANGNVERARFYIRRVNNVPDQANPESLWLGIRIEQKLNNVAERDELAAALRSKFPSSREVTALELGRFDE